jgi:hypothetical protein
VMLANGADAGRPAVPDGDAVAGDAVAGPAVEGAADVPCAASGPPADASTPTTSAQYLWVIEEISSERVVKWRARRARFEGTTPDAGLRSSGCEGMRG